MKNEEKRDQKWCLKNGTKRTENIIKTIKKRRGQKKDMKKTTKEKVSRKLKNDKNTVKKAIRKKGIDEKDNRRRIGHTTVKNGTKGKC